MAVESLPVAEYKRGFLLGANGYQGSAYDAVSEKLPQLHALLTVLTDCDWSWNDEIKTELIHLARGVANDIHEAFKEDQQERFSGIESHSLNAQQILPRGVENV